MMNPILIASLCLLVMSSCKNSVDKCDYLGVYSSNDISTIEFTKEGNLTICIESCVHYNQSDFARLDDCKLDFKKFNITQINTDAIIYADNEKKIEYKKLKEWDSNTSWDSLSIKSLYIIDTTAINRNIVIYKNGMIKFHSSELNLKCKLKLQRQKLLFGEINRISDKNFRFSRFEEEDAILKISVEKYSKGQITFSDSGLDFYHNYLEMRKLIDNPKKYIECSN